MVACRRQWMPFLIPLSMAGERLLYFTEYCVIRLFVLFGRPPSTMDAVSASILAAGKRFVENKMSCRIKLIFLIFYQFI